MCVVDNTLLNKLINKTTPDGDKFLTGYKYIGWYKWCRLIQRRDGSRQNGHRRYNSVRSCYVKYLKDKKESGGTIRITTKLEKIKSIKLLRKERDRVYFGNRKGDQWSWTRVSNLEIWSDAGEVFRIIT